MNAQTHIKRHPRGTSQDGSFLVVVMWITAILVSVALYFGNTMLMEYKAASYAAAGYEAAQAIDGARRHIAYVLDELTEPGDLPTSDLMSFDGVEIGNAQYWVIGRGYNSTLLQTGVTFGLIDEASKLDLNRAQYEQFLWLPEVPIGIPERINDWRDEDDEITGDYGAESQDYLLGDPAYHAKNGDFESVEELRFILADDFDYLYGEDTNRNGVLDPNEDDGDAALPYDDMDGELGLGIIEYVTVDVSEPESLPIIEELLIATEGSAERVNVSANNSRNQLQSILEAVLDDRASEIMNGLRNWPYQSVLELYAASGMTAEEFEVIDGYLYQQDSDEPPPVLVNVNTVSEEVLVCALATVPDAETIASQIIAYRQSLDENALNSLAWVTDAIESSMYPAVGPFIKGTTFQIAADIAAVGQHGRGFRRELFIFDTSGEDGAEVVYRRDLTRLGWPLGEAIRLELQNPTGESSSF